MGHLFVPAALVLWGVVALVRTFSAPAPAAAPTPAVEVEVKGQQPHPEELSARPVSEAPRAPAAHGEG